MKIFLIICFLFSVLSSFAQDSAKYFLKKYGWEFVNQGGNVFQLEDSSYLIGGGQGNVVSGKWNGYAIKTNKFGDTLWTKRYIYSSNNFMCMIRTKDKKYIATGWVDVDSIHYRTFLVKIDTDGTLLWSKIIGDSTYSNQTSHHNNQAFAITEAKDGGYLLAGSWVDSLTYWQFYVIKTDPNGNMEWDSVYRHPPPYANSYFSNVKATEDSGFILVGDRDFLVDEGAIEMMKIDKNGKIVWENIFDPSIGGDFAVDILFTKDGGYIITGVANNIGSIGEEYIFKLDSGRQLQWELQSSGSGAAGKIIETSDSRYVYISGQCVFSCDFFLTKIDSTDEGTGQGKVIWERRYGDSEDNYGYDVQETSDSGFIISGRWDTVGGAADVLLLKTNCLGFTGPPEAKFNTVINNNTVSFTNTSDSAGDFRWYFGDGDSFVYENPWITFINYKGEVTFKDTFIHIYKDTGTYIVTLYAGACGEWDTITQIVRIDSVATSVNELQITNCRLQIYPNPTYDKLNIKIENGKSGMFEMFDVTGRMILQSAIRNPHSTISISYLASGIYIYKFTDKEGRMARGKIVKQ